MTRADEFAPLDDETRARWMKFARPGTTLFPQLVGLVIEDVRVDYCRMRLPFRPELLQAGGIVHGGAIATILDSVMVPAVGAPLAREARFSTVDMQLQYLGAVRDEDIVAEGWVTRRGRSVSFCRSEATAEPSGRAVGAAMLTYHVAS